jgi:hypothetical protein
MRRDIVAALNAGQTVLLVSNNAALRDHARDA